MVIVPFIFTLAHATPSFLSLLLVPIRALLKFQLPVDKVTSAAAYEVFDPVSNPSTVTVAADTVNAKALEVPPPGPGV